MVVWKTFPFGGLEGNPTFLRGAPPKDSLITQGTSCGYFFKEHRKVFPLFVRLWGSKTEDDSAEGLLEESLEEALILSLGINLN